MPLTSADQLNDPVTAHMRRDVPRLSLHDTVGQALAKLRSQPPEGRIIYFYVVDAEDRLHGVVPTRRLLLSPLEQPLAEIMVRQVIAIPHTATVLEACEFFTLHRLLAFPIVDESRRLLGLVDVDLYTEEILELEEAGVGDELFQLIGVTAAQARRPSALEAFRYRFPWLVCNLASGIVAAFLAGIFENVLAKVVALALFIPVVLALAESVAMQSVSLTLQMLHGQRPTLTSLSRKLRTELQTGLLLGLASAAVVGLFSFLWDGTGRVALCLLGGIGGGVAAAALLGIALPYALRLLRRDPQVAAGPIALAAADLVTLGIYFNLAWWLWR